MLKLPNCMMLCLEVNTKKFPKSKTTQVGLIILNIKILVC